MPTRKDVVWIEGEIHTPPFSTEARIEAGELLGKLQDGEALSMPHSRPMPNIGARVGELRVNDGAHKWRIIYRADADAVSILEVFDKKTPTTPARVINNCISRLHRYDE